MSNTNQDYDNYTPLVYKYTCMYTLNEIMESNYITVRYERGIHWDNSLVMLD